MKLIFCPRCQDIVKLHQQVTTCKCGRSHGAYLDGYNAVYCGDAIPLGIINDTIAYAIENQPASGKGKQFNAFVIPKKCPTFKRVRAVGTTEENHEAITPLPDSSKPR